VQKGGKVRFSRVFNTPNLSSSCMPHLTCFIFTAFLLLVPWSDSCAEVSVADTTRVDVVYKSTEQGQLKLDLHYPKNGNG
jgi:hypothetical protein